MSHLTFLFGGERLRCRAPAGLASLAYLTLT